jgi:hypothetical protein
MRSLWAPMVCGSRSSLGEAPVRKQEIHGSSCCCKQGKAVLRRLIRWEDRSQRTAYERAQYADQRGNVHSARGWPGHNGSGHRAGNRPHNNPQ